MNRIYELRTERNMTQQKLAEALGVGRTTITNYEGDRNDLDTDTIRRLCEIFGCTADYLLCMSDQRTAQISDFDAALLAAFYAAPENIQNGIREMLRPFLSTETSSASQSAQEG